MKESLEREGVLSPKNIEKRLNGRHSYMQVWRAVNEAKGLLYGTEDSSYSRLRSFFELCCEANPGTIAVTETTEDNHFKRCFLALNVSIAGYQWCKPIIAVDGTFRKTKNIGVVLVAATVDGNGRNFPLCWSVVRSENREDVVWFLNLMNQQFLINKDVAFISDRGDALLYGIATMFPENPHAFCVKHL
ncbi:hypothetical protein RCL1_000148 [Eukaryota sp. TZLM3-RCL]